VVTEPQLREAPVMYERTCVDLDVHARSILACAIDNETGQIRSLRLGPATGTVLEWVGSLPGPVAVTYEAGPTGFGLARLLRIGELPAVRVPSEAEEAARDLVRAREDVRGDLMRARHRLSKLLLRQGLLYDGAAWTGAHDVWLRSLVFDRTGVRLAFDEAYDAVLTTAARRARLDTAITEMAASPGFVPIVGRLGCLRGVSTLTAFGLATEIVDWRRFTGASIGAYLGLVPAESSSGQQRSQGPITKTGNTHARRLLVEAAWHHRKRYRPSRELLRRQDGQPAEVRARAELGNRRLHRRWVRFDARSKRPTVSVVAVARELAGWCWSLAIKE
jgi:transposase